jgi:hypothetical protein
VTISCRAAAAGYAGVLTELAGPDYEIDLYIRALRFGLRLDEDSQPGTPLCYSHITDNCEI